MKMCQVIIQNVIPDFCVCQNWQIWIVCPLTQFLSCVLGRLYLDTYFIHFLFTFGDTLSNAFSHTLLDHTLVVHSFVHLIWFSEACDDDNCDDNDDFCRLVWNNKFPCGDGFSATQRGVSSIVLFRIFTFCEENSCFFGRQCSCYSGLLAAVVSFCPLPTLWPMDHFGKVWV